MALNTVLSHFSYPPIEANTDTNPRLEKAITVYEPEFLRAFLGYKLYALYIAGVDAATAKYLDIKNGKAYTDSSEVDQYWDGFVAGKNPIANYVYFKYLNDTREVATGAGTAVATHESMTAASSHRKQVQAWNAMVDMCWNLHEFLVANEDEYPDYVGLTNLPCRTQKTNILPNQNLFIPLNIWGF